MFIAPSPQSLHPFRVDRSQLEGKYIKRAKTLIIEAVSTCHK
jgi:hypothetical protein